MPYKSVRDIVADLEANPAEAKAHLYHPIPFPEFDRLTTTTARPEAERKRDVIASALLQRFPGGLAGRRILDIGANAGLYTFHLASLGAHVTAYEGHPRYGPIGAFLAKDRAPNVDWHDGFFAESDLQAPDATFDVCLMLSVFQWITHGDDRLEEGHRLLRTLSRRCGMLVFELGLNAGGSAVTTRDRNHIRALHRMLRDHTEYDAVTYLGSTRPWASGERHLFACTRGPPKVRAPGQWRKHAPWAARGRAGPVTPPGERP